MLNKEDIMNIIPHRDDMLLVEEIDVIDENTCIGRYTIKGDEFFLNGHFPGRPIVPGVILCEMMAQSACGLFKDKMNDALPVYTGLNNVKFKGQVKPGDTVEFKCEIAKVKHPFYFFKGCGTVDGKVCMVGDFSFAIIKG